MDARYLRAAVESDVKEKMVFIGGPRQVGKTTFALSILPGDQDETSPAYLSWDSLEDREQLLAAKLPPSEKLVIFDEIHKYVHWRNLVKGLYDKNKSSVRFILTGSARLDYYRKGGDSLQGRYHYHRLHPFSLTEVSRTPDSGTVEQLLRFGGFPEPFTRSAERFHRRWLRELSNRVIHEDLNDLENVRDVSNLDLLLHHLPTCVGSPLSVNSLSKLLQVAPRTVDNWLTMFERLYLCYRIPPFGGSRIRAVKKEKKLVSQR